MELKKLIYTVQDGIAFTAKKVLQYAVILLGFGLNLAQIAAVGAESLPIILTTIATALIVGYILYRVLSVDSAIATLIAVGSSICGGSAIAATAPVIRAKDEQVAQAISVIFLFNVVAALIFPTLGGMLGMSNEGFGLFAGTAVNDTSSVTAAAAAWDGMHPGSNALDDATIVKLTRTLAIIPITLVLGIVMARKEGADGLGNFSLKRAFPMFILFFLVASIITTIAVGLGGKVQYALEGSVFVGGAVIQWVRDEMRFLTESRDAEYYAQKVPDTGGVYLVPAFTGLGAPYWDMYARGCIVGLTRGTRREHIIRAAQESIAYQVCDLATAMEKDTGIPLDQLRADGGASRDGFLLQFQADILDRQVRRPVVRETTALGAAYLAGLAVGVWKDQEEIEGLWKCDVTFDPDMAPQRRETLLSDWHRAVDRSRGWAR